MNDVESFSKQRLLINSNGDIFTKFDELVSVIKMLIAELNHIDQ